MGVTVVLLWMTNNGVNPAHYNCPCLQPKVTATTYKKAIQL